MLIFVNILIFLILLYILKYMANKYYKFSKRVFVGLGLGILFGIYLNYFFKTDTISYVKEVLDIVGKGYVNLLKMISMPLIIISILSSVVNIDDEKSATKIGGLIISILLSTAAIASFISVFVTIFFKLNAANISPGIKEIEAGEKILSRVATVNQSLSSKIISFIPTNPFLDITGARSTSIIATVVFCLFVGYAILTLKSKKKEQMDLIIKIINASHDVVMKLVTLVLRLTPYGVLALIASTLSTSNYSEIYKLVIFVIASYIAIIIMYIIHLIMVMLSGLSPIIFIKKSFGALSFAFSSRTSAGTLPLTIQAQQDMGIDETIANLSSTFGVYIGQNGCAAIYPTMLAFMIAPTLGINVLDPLFIAKVILVVTVSSLGVAGVGGGATFASIIVLTTLGFPVTLAGLLISVEPLIDMARTALNVNDSILSGLLTSRILGKIDIEKYNKD